MSPVQPPFDREVLIFAGKGGVGKTTVSSAVALHTARAGRRTLLVTIDPAQRLEDALGVPVGHRIQPVQGALHAMMLDPEKVIQDTLRELWPDRDLTQHPLYKYISNYMPGLNELLAIGQLAEIRRERDFDCIVVDTAPTGHALSFLTTPMKVSQLLRESVFLQWAARGYGVYRTFSRGAERLKGLLRRADDWVPPAPDVDLKKVFADLSERAAEIHRLLQDPKRTALSLVTVPERLAVEETLDLHDYVTKTLGIAVAALVANNVTPDILGAAARPFDRFAVDADARRDLEDRLERDGYPRALLRGLVHATEFHQRRRAVSVEHLRLLEKRLPNVPRFVIGLQREDVHGFERLRGLEEQLFETPPSAPAR